MISAVVMGVLGVASGVVLARWLDTQAYRYDDETEFRRRRVLWVVPVVAIGAAAFGWRFDGSPVVLVTYGLALVWMAGLAAIDIDVRRLPDVWTLPGIPVAAALLALCSWAVEDGQRWLVAVGCGAAYAAIFLVLSIINPSGLGLGDVKLALPLGMLTGWFGVSVAVFAFVSAFVIGLVMGIVAAIVTGAGRKATFPFGPAMLLGAALAIGLLGPAYL